jgi:uncharacterized protein
MAEGQVLQLWRYPVKGMAGERLQSARLGAGGVGGDRVHALFDADAPDLAALTGRDVPGIGGWTAAYPFAPDAALRPEDPPVAVVMAPDGQRYQWGDPRMRDLLSRQAGRLVDLRRDPSGALQEHGRSTLVTTEATRRALENEHGVPVDLRRFRPNVHLQLNAAPWAELEWEGTVIVLGDGITLRVLGPCEHDGTVFGVNARVTAGGRVQIGDRATVNEPDWRPAYRPAASASTPERPRLQTPEIAADMDGDPPSPKGLLNSMLRIDETSKTLVAPQASAFVTEAAPDQHELLTLVSSSWEAFAGELGHHSLRFLDAAPVPGIDVLAFDEATGRVVVVQVLGHNTRDQLHRSVDAAARVAALDAAGLAAVHPALEAAVPGDTPEIVLISGEFDEDGLGLAEWLVRRHGFEMSGYGVAAFRFGGERLLSIRRVHPHDPSAPQDPAAEVREMMLGTATTADPTLPPAPSAAAVAQSASAPPPRA